MAVGKIITLLTDFGDRDVYVGVLKGVIANINRQLQVIDLTHQIPPQNIVAARFALLSAYPYFPPQTVHIAVVDPGVGSNRRSVAIEFPQGYIVCPDNGLVSGILELTPAIAAVELTNTQYWRVSQPSTTFHGRDIFAAVGAHLASGIPLEALGEAIDLHSLVRLENPAIAFNHGKIIGSIQYIDHFGNLITNVAGDLVKGKTWHIVYDRLIIYRGNTYNDVAHGSAVTLIGSHGWVEIAINGGNAHKELKINWADSIQIVFD